jgi:hypothetical protein
LERYFVMETIFTSWDLPFAVIEKISKRRTNSL